MQFSGFSEALSYPSVNFLCNRLLAVVGVYMIFSTEGFHAHRDRHCPYKLNATDSDRIQTAELAAVHTTLRRYAEHSQVLGNSLTNYTF